MIRRNLLRSFALGLCMSALFAGCFMAETAYAQSIGGTSPAYGGAVNEEDKILFEKQAEMDQYLFADHTEEIEKMGFKVIYTGVAYNYVEVGITPYTENNAVFLYNKFGKELVKVVDAEVASVYSVPEDISDVMPVDKDNVEKPVMDMGDTSISDSAEDEALINEREQMMADEEEKLSIQITSINLDEPSEGMDPELIWQTGAAADIPVDDSGEKLAEDGADIRLVSAEDNMKVTSAAADVENTNKGIPTLSIVAVVAAGLLIIGGTAYTTVKKRAVKKN